MTRNETALFFMTQEMWGKMRKLVGRHHEPKRFLLAKLLGKKSYDDMLATFTEEDKQTCLALLGPHGYAFYRALLIKRGMEDRDYIPACYYRDDGVHADGVHAAEKTLL